MLETSRFLGVMLKCLLVLSETHAAVCSEQLAQQSRAAAALGQQEVPQGVRYGPTWSLVYSVQVEEGVHALRRLAPAPDAPQGAGSASQVNLRIHYENWSTDRHYNVNATFAVNELDYSECGSCRAWLA